MSNIYDVKVKEKNNGKVREFYEKAMKELISFYGINWVNNTPKIYLVDSRGDFDKLYGCKTEDWVVGSIIGDNKILLLSPESYETESRHTYSDDKYFSLLKHELSHLFYTILSKGKGPLWLDEGFSIYTSNQLSTKERPKEFKEFFKYYKHGDEGIYAEAGFVVEDLIERYGKDMVLEFLKILPNVNNEEEFNMEFERYFGIGLDYTNFNRRNI